MDNIDAIAAHYGVDRSVILQCVDMTTSRLENVTREEVYECIMSAIAPEEFLPEMQSEIFTRFPPETFFKICRINVEHARKCKQASYWKAYLQGRSEEDWAEILTRIPIYGRLDLYASLVKSYTEKFKEFTLAAILDIESVFNAVKADIASNESPFKNEKLIKYVGDIMKTNDKILFDIEDEQISFAKRQAIIIAIVGHKLYEILTAMNVEDRKGAIAKLRSDFDAYVRDNSGRPLPNEEAFFMQALAIAFIFDSDRSKHAMKDLLSKVKKERFYNVSLFYIYVLDIAATMMQAYGEDEEEEEEGEKGEYSLLYEYVETKGDDYEEFHGMHKYGVYTMFTDFEFIQ